MSQLEARYHTKNRIVAVDIVRMMAAFAVMFGHLSQNCGGGPITKMIPPGIVILLTTLSPLFFVLAGYFASRNVTWKKSLNNSWWSLTPFILWNSICIIVFAALSHLPEKHNIVTLFGIQSIICKEWVLFPEYETYCWPVNGPLWFMRDLMLLFLLTPILAKWARFVFPASIILSLIPQFTPNFSIITSGIFASPRSIVFFAAGCFLQTFSKEQQKKVLSFYSPTIIIGYFVIIVADLLTVQFIRNSAELALSKGLLAIWIFYQIARWIEVKLPVVTPLALKYAPVTFLTFATHTLLFVSFRIALEKKSPNFLQTDAVLIFPFIAFVLLSLFFFALKRWCPCLLHLVAHYKLRPDDLKPSKKE